MNLLKDLRTGIPAFFLPVFFTLLANSAAHAESIGFSLSNDPSSPAGQMTVTVRNDLTGELIADALVSIGAEIGSTELAQQRTSPEGTAVFRLAGQKARVVHASKESFTTISIVGVQSSRVTIDLKPLPSSQIILHGNLGGFGPIEDDSLIYTGIVFKSLSVFDLLDFSIKSLISPLKDSIDVFGPRKIPSNLALPKQAVSIPFGSINLDKPYYRLPLEGSKAVRLTGVQGELKMTDALGLSSGFKIDFLNKIRFTKVGVSKNLIPSSDAPTNIVSNLPLVPFHTVRVNEPPFSADVLTAAFVDVAGDRETLMATDVKVPLGEKDAVSSREISLTSIQNRVGTTRALFTLAIAEQGKRLSGIISEPAGPEVRPGEYLDIPHLDPAAQLPPSVAIGAPEKGIGSVVFESAPQPGTDKPVAVWTVYALPSAGEIQVPTQKLGSGIQRYRLLKLQFSGEFDENAIDGNLVLRNLQRFGSAWAKIGG